MFLTENDVIKALKEGCNLAYIAENTPEYFWIRKDFVLQCVRENDNMLSIVPTKAIDKEIMLESVRKAGWTLVYGPEESKDDEEVVAEAVENFPGAILDASDRLATDRKYLRSLILDDEDDIMTCIEKLNSDKAKILEKEYEDRCKIIEITGNPEELKNLPDDRNNYELMRRCVMRNSKVAEYIGDELKKNPNVMLNFVQYDSDVAKNIDESLYVDEKFCSALNESLMKGIEAHLKKVKGSSEKANEVNKIFSEIEARIIAANSGRESARENKIK